MDLSSQSLADESTKSKVTQQIHVEYAQGQHLQWQQHL